MKKAFPESAFWLSPRRAAVALDGVDFVVPPGRSVGIVGESGSGKSTLVRCILGLESLDAGEIYFSGKDLQRIGRAEQRRIRSDIQPIFQDPGSSLNPKRTVGQIVLEPLIVHRHYSRAERREEVREMLQLVGLQPRHATKFPHELSGGERQRVSIARALILKPRLIVADEPTSALDVSVQAQILNLLRKLRSQFGLTLLFISHNLAVVRYMCDEVGIMYLGRLVEFGPTDEVFRTPAHPYTRVLLATIPKVLSARYQQPTLDRVVSGEIPSPFNIPVGCRFHTRCPEAMSVCSLVDPEVRAAHSRGYAACHLLSPAEEVPGESARTIGRVR